ncbi:hypothetical protein PVAP13_2NG336219 [Panicum virgatum]|uniref:Uncharacterized protein n=2 Tax=Panicum virgatum TaxID=38727 RepID=A0A8T0VEH7_PANVG|nr:hypothetical protein PVAP13_2NG336219 [Panicum virgatum]
MRPAAGRGSEKEAGPAVLRVGKGWVDHWRCCDARRMYAQFKFALLNPPPTLQRAAMAFVLVDHDGSSTGSEAAAADNVTAVDLPPRSASGGHYRPAAAAAGAGALHWLPFAAAVSAVRALLGASHEDLRLRAHQLSRALSGAFFVGAAAGAPFDGGGARFPEGGLYVCPDLPPLAPAVRAVQRALMHVAVKEASHAACDCFYDVVRNVMWQLVGDAPDGRGPAVFGRDKFETAFALEWVE